MAAIFCPIKEEKGFILIESLIALTVVTVALTLYSPSAASFTRRVKEEREKTFLTRQELERSRRELKNIENKVYFQEVSYDEEEKRSLTDEEQGHFQKGTHVTDEEWTTEVFLLEIPHEKETPKSTVTQE